MYNKTYAVAGHALRLINLLTRGLVQVQTYKFAAYANTKVYVYIFFLIRVQRRKITNCLTYPFQCLCVFM